MKEALKLALEALELNNREWKATADSGDSGYWLAEEQAFYQQAEKAIIAIKEALAQPEQDNTYGYASRLATAIWQKHYMKDSPKWKPLNTTEGVLTQIDNMTCGLVKEKPSQPEQEPVACVVPHGATMRLEWASVDAAHNAKIGPLYTTPPQRTWVELTDEEVKKIAYNTAERKVAKDIEAKLKEKNDC